MSLGKGLNMPKSERYTVGLDIGTTHICCVVGEVNESGRVDIVGLQAESSLQGEVEVARLVYRTIGTHGSDASFSSKGKFELDISIVCD